MRISTQMQNQMLSNNIRKDQEAVYKTTEQMASGVKFEKASDDPQAWARAAELRRTQGQFEQYDRNSALLESQLGFIDQSLNAVSDILQSASEVAVRASDSTLSTSDRSMLSEQVNQLLEELVSQANGEYNGQHLFGGVRSDVEPFSVTRTAEGQIDSVTYVGASTTSNISVAEQDVLPGQVVGGDPDNGVLMSDASDAFAVLIQMRDQLKSGESLAETDIQSQVDTAYERVIVGRAVMGAYLEHITFVSEIRLNQTVRLAEDLSRTEGVDLAQAATELSEKQTAYQAALAMASQTMRKSLLDYM
ncbi:MAG: flagellar hook-associated protein FlgL [Pontiellaceae bacterium]|nr:flagellar hook-associated protein FlgL [Pontiellaceae bacterium]